MKNKILSALAATTMLWSLNASADIKLNTTQGSTVVIQTPHQAKYYDGLDDLFIAVGVGDLEFVKKIVEQDKDIIKKYIRPGQMLYKMEQLEISSPPECTGMMPGYG